MHPILQKAIDGEVLTSEDVRAYGGYQKLDEDLRQHYALEEKRRKAAVRQSVQKDNSAKHAGFNRTREQSINDWQKSVQAHRAHGYGQLLFILLVIPAMLYGCVSMCSGS